MKPMKVKRLNCTSGCKFYGFNKKKGSKTKNLIKEMNARWTKEWHKNWEIDQKWINALGIRITIRTSTNHMQFIIINRKRFPVFKDKPIYTFYSFILCLLARFFAHQIAVYIVFLFCFTQHFERLWSLSSLLKSLTLLRIFTPMTRFSLL